MKQDHTCRKPCCTCGGKVMVNDHYDVVVYKSEKKRGRMLNLNNIYMAPDKFVVKHLYFCPKCGREFMQLLASMEGE